MTDSGLCVYAVYCIHYLYSIPVFTFEANAMIVLIAIRQLFSEADRVVNKSSYLVCLRQQALYK